MQPGHRNEYLKAMGIDVWNLRVAAVPHAGLDIAAALPSRRESGFGRPAEPSPAAIVIGPGNSNTLLLCGSAAEAATLLAADIARCLDCEPVWGWPARSSAEQGMPLEQAIEERLFTRLVIFGPGLFQSGGEAHSTVVRSARTIQADPIEVLQQSGSARQRLWQQLSDSTWCATHAPPER